jgi:ADP-heptose:LPS heptosyltransferase
MHLAVASELRVISLFGPTNDAVYSPKGDKNIVIRTKENYDYFKSLKINENKSYMSSIKPETVFKSFEKIINDDIN